VTWHQVIASFRLSVASPTCPFPSVPDNVLFIVERVWCGEPPRTSIMYSDLPLDLE